MGTPGSISKHKFPGALEKQCSSHVADLDTAGLQEPGQGGPRRLDRQHAEDGDIV